MNGNRLVMGLALGLTLVAGCTKPADPPTNPPQEGPKPERPVSEAKQPKAEQPEAPKAPGAPAGLSEMRAKLDEVKRERAQLQCINLGRAAIAYQLSPANPDAKPPTSPKDLLAPPFGGPPFLPSADNLKDPWGKEFKLELRTQADGSEYPLFSTTAPDGTPISQFGIGEMARPKDEQPPKK